MTAEERERIEELTHRALDGRLTETESEELDARLAANAAAWEHYRQLLEVERALRNLDETFDVTEPVMTRIRALPHPPASRHAAPPHVVQEVEPERLESEVDRWFVRLAVPVGLAAALVVALVLVFQGDPHADHLAVTTGTVTIQRDGSPRELPPRSVLQPRDQIGTPERETATIQYGDKTRVKIAGRSQVVYDAPFAFRGAVSKRLELLSGRLFANVREQDADGPFVIKTPHAFAIVRGTRFSLESDDRLTALHVEKGRVDLRRAEDGKTVQVEAGTFALAGPAGDFVTRPERIRDGLIAYYTFQEGEGGVVRDRSGFGTALDLVASGPQSSSGTWPPTGGHRFPKPGHWRSEAPARKIVDACEASRAVSVEAWIEPASTRQAGPARIVTLSKTSATVNFLLGQDDEGYTARILTTEGPKAKTHYLTGVGPVSTRLTHLVWIRPPDGKCRLYIDGEKAGSTTAEGYLSSWDRHLHLALGNDPGAEDRLWKGTFHLAAIYSRGLTAEEVQQNFASGARQTASTE